MCHDGYEAGGPYVLHYILTAGIKTSLLLYLLLRGLRYVTRTWFKKKWRVKFVF
ncbi:hypothetical protein BDR03DRAFT_944211 [Suillus americanus]|nr:hypothetical protein BDR03DRAFT_944211 [Suillus americanus]